MGYRLLRKQRKKIKVIQNQIYNLNVLTNQKEREAHEYTRVITEDFVDVFDRAWRVIQSKRGL